MSIRRLIGLGLLLLALGVVVSVLWRRSDSDRAETTIERGPRSVVLVTVDTTRADRLEPYGAQDVATPVLSNLADRGVTFEHAYSVAPITLVAHTSILTGQYPFQHRVRNNGTQYVPDEATTLAEVLQGEGYRTAAFVSAAVLERRYGLDQGFEVYDDDLSAGRDRSPRMVADRPAEASVAAAFEWLESVPNDERFFLWVHLYDPHARYSPPPPYRDDYRERPYDGEIAYMDSQIGRLLRHPRLGGEEPAIVTVIGDHGESLGEHGEETHAVLAYDSTLHIPWILSVPGGPKGLRVAQTVGQTDLMPTLLALLDLDRGPVTAGRDLTSVLESGGGPREEGTRYYSETYLPYYTYGWAKLRVLRQGRWKYIDAPRPELYNLVADPRELSDVAQDQPGYAHDLRRDLGELLAQVEDSEAEAALALDPEAEEKLRSLGYLAAGSRRQERSGERPDPKDVIELHAGLERARALLQDRLYTPAERVLTDLLRRDPENLAALIEMVAALEGLGRTEEAVTVVTRALQLDPEYQRLYVVLARLEESLGNIDQTRELLELATGKDPNNPAAILEQAGFLARQGDRVGAERVLGDALARFQDHPALNVYYANLVELPKGQVAGAETRLRQALEADPFLSFGWSVLGRILERTGRAEEAEAGYREGLRRRSDSPDLHASLGLLLAQRGEHSEAEQQLREAIRLSGKFRSDLHVALGGTLAERGRFEEAQREYQRVLDVDPDDPGALNNRAIALFRSGELGEAESLLERLVARHPGMADAHNNLSALALERGEWRRAEFHARQTVELNGEAVQAWNNLAIALQEQGKPQEAREAYGRALALEPGYWEAQFNLGVLLRGQRELEEAVRAFEEVLVQRPGDAGTHRQLGELFDGPLADPARARIHFNAFLKHAPGHPDAAAVRERLTRLSPAVGRSTPEGD